MSEHREDEALRQRLADENLARASRIEPPRARFPAPPMQRERYFTSADFDKTASELGVPLPRDREADPSYLQPPPPVPTSNGYLSQRLRVLVAWLVLGALVALAAVAGVWWFA